MKILIKLIITTLLILLLNEVLEGIQIRNYLSAFIFAIVLAVLNVLVKPVLVLFTIPATIVTLGLFLLVINALIILIGDYFVKGIDVDGFWTAFIFSILLSIGQSILNKIFLEEK